MQAPVTSAHPHDAMQMQMADPAGGLNPLNHFSVESLMQLQSIQQVHHQRLPYGNIYCNQNNYYGVHDVDGVVDHVDASGSSAGWYPPAPSAKVTSSPSLPEASPSLPESRGSFRHPASSASVSCNSSSVSSASSTSAHLSLFRTPFYSNGSVGSVGSVECHKYN